MCTSDVPWLSESPITGTLPAGANQPVQVTFDAGVPDITQPGSYFAQLKIKNDTPYIVENIPVTMTVVLPVSPTVSFTSNSPVLVGNPMVFTNTSDPGQPPATEYLWDFDDGITETVGTTATLNHVYATFGTYTVTLKACNVVGCSTFTADVMVLPKVILLPLVNKH
jgi:PKD repeat protein